MLLKPLLMVLNFYCGLLWADIYAERHLTSQNDLTVGSKIKIRKIASVERNQLSQFMTLYGTKKPETSLGGSVGIYGGLSSVTSVGTIGSTEETLATGVDLSMTGWKYFGLDIEGYKTFRTPSFSGAHSSKNETHSGILSNTRIQYPIVLGNFTFIPKAGVGYGWIRRSSESELSVFVTTLIQPTTSDLSLSGPFAVIGLEALYNDFVIFADYLQSLSSAGTFTVTVEGRSEIASSVQSRFDRLRIGTEYHLTEHFLFGIRAIKRSLESFTPSQYQLLGIMRYRF